jgi:surface protein
MSLNIPLGMLSGIVDYGNDFVCRVITKSTPDTFGFVCQDVGIFDAWIDWGDGSDPVHITTYADGDLDYTYADEGSYIVRISGDFPNFYYNGNQWVTLIDEIIQFGDTSLLKMGKAFKGGKFTKVGGIANMTAVDDFSEAFMNADLVTQFNLESWVTSNATNMNSMFYGASAATVINVDNFDTKAVSDMKYMFRDTGAVIDLDISHFDTGANTDFSWMFAYSNATSIDVSTLDTSEALTMAYMFTYASVTSLDLSTFDFTKVTTMAEMFRSCRDLVTITMPTSSTPALEGGNTGLGLNRTFYYCDVLTTLDVSNWDVSGLTSLFETFYNCKLVTTLDVSGWITTSSLLGMNSTFRNMNAVTTLDLSSFVTSGVQTFEDCFSGCSSLTSIDVSSFVTSTATQLGSMFAFSGTAGNTLDVSNFRFVTGNVLDASMFASSNWGTINVTGWNKETDTFFGGYLFSSANCTTIIGLDGWITSALTSCVGLFSSASNLTDLAIDDWDIVELINLNALASGVTIPTSRYDDILIKWGAQSLPTLTGTSPNFGLSKYTPGGAAEAGRDALELGWGFAISDGGPV